MLRFRTAAPASQRQRRITWRRVNELRRLRAFLYCAQGVGGGGRAVTLTCNSELIGAGDLDGWVEARGEVLRETGSLIFVRGLITQRHRTLLAFSGALKKIRA